MKKRYWLVPAVVLSAVLLFLVGPKAQAWMAFRTADNLTVAQSQTVNRTMWLAGRNIDIAGTVNGDLYCAAQNLNISGKVTGDIICAAQTVNITGSVEGSLRVAGQTVNLSGPVGRNATMAGQTVNIDSRAVINGDASIGAQSLNMLGTVSRDLAVAAGNASISGQVGRNLQATVDQLNLLGSAKIGGGLSYTSKNTIYKASSAVIGGPVFHTVPQTKNPQIYRFSLMAFGWFAIFIMISLIATALVVTAIAPRVVNSVSQNGIDRPWLSLSIGFLAAIVVPISLILILITCVGLPLAVLFGLAWLLINLSSGIFSSYWLGRQILRRQRNPLLIILLGSTVLLLVYLIPIVGIFAIVLATWLGQGMILLEIKARLRRPHYKVTPLTE